MIKKEYIQPTLSIELMETEDMIAGTWTETVGGAPDYQDPSQYHPGIGGTIGGSNPSDEFAKENDWFLDDAGFDDFF